MTPRAFRTGPVTAPPPGYKMSRHAWLPIDMVHPDPENARKDLGDLTDLTADMHEHGLIAPIEVRTTPDDPDRDFVITAGHRRHAAACILGWSFIESIIRGEMPRADVLERMISENGQREPLHPLDEAAALHEIFHARKLGSQQQLAYRVGRKLPYVSGRLALLDLPPQQQDELRAGTLGLTEAIEMAREISGRARPKPAQKKKKEAPAERPPQSNVRAAVARAYRAEAQHFRDHGAGLGVLEEAYEAAAWHLDDRAADIEAGKADLP